MIVGLKFRLTSKELAEHCTGRASYHRRKADEKSAELPGLKEAMERIKASAPAKDVSHMSKGGYLLDPSSAVDNLESDIRDHRNKALVFDFFAEHFFDEDYDLKEDDLVRLEILKRF